MNKKFSIAILVCALLITTLVVRCTQIQAASPQNGVVTLSFDDGLPCHYDTVFPLMSARGLHGTFFVPTGYCPNLDCQGCMISIPQLLEMQTAGNEIGSHSVSHPDFTALSDGQINIELEASKQYLASNGITINNFAYPYGTGDLNHADSIAKNYYRSARGIWYNSQSLPCKVFHLPAYTSEMRPYSVVLNALKNAVNNAVANNEWVIFIFHYVTDLNSATMYGGMVVEDFTNFLNYIVSSGVNVLTVNEALNVGGSEPAPIPAPQPTQISISITLQPLGLTMKYNETSGFCWKAPSEISMWNRSWTFQQWENGDTNQTRTFVDNGNYQINYA